MQPLVIEQIIYRGPDEPTTYCCEHCGKDIEEKHKTRMFAAHRWEATAKGDGETYGYNAGQLYLPYGWTSWVEIGGLREAAKSAQKDGDHDAMKAFYNVRLGLPWSERSATTSAEDIKATATGLSLGLVPDDCVLLTSAWDVQGNRLEGMAFGWAYNFTKKRVELATVQRWVIPGTPTDRATYKELLSVLDSPIPRESGGGDLHISLVMIDAGNWTQDIIDFTRKNKNRVLQCGRGQTILPIRGENRYGTPIISRTPDKVDITLSGKVRKRGGKVWRIGTVPAKDWIFGRVTTGVFRWSDDLPLEFFEQLTAEVRKTKIVGGRKTPYYDHIPGQPNEGLDITVYNVAAGFYLDLAAKPEAWWKKKLDELNKSKADPAEITRKVGIQKRQSRRYKATRW
jgi:phage terminase large subunit GpA-like protein